MLPIWSSQACLQRYEEHYYSLKTVRPDVDWFAFVHARRASASKTSDGELLLAHCRHTSLTRYSTTRLVAQRLTTGTLCYLASLTRCVCLRACVCSSRRPAGATQLAWLVMQHAQVNASDVWQDSVRSLSAHESENSDPYLDIFVKNKIIIIIIKSSFLLLLLLPLKSSSQWLHATHLVCVRRAIALVTHISV